MGNSPVAYKLSENTMVLTDSEGYKLPIKTVTAYKRFKVYKGATAGMKTAEDFEKFIRGRTYPQGSEDKPFPSDPIIPSWYGLKDTAELYGDPIQGKSVYVFEFTRDATFIDLTDLDTVKNLIMYIYDLNKPDNWKAQLEAELNLMTGACSLKSQAKLIEENVINEKTSSDEKRDIRAKIRSNTKLKPQIMRQSYYHTDLVASRKLCHIFLDTLPGIDGYLGRECENYSGGLFHSEIMTCNFTGILKFLGVEQIKQKS